MYFSQGLWCNIFYPWGRVVLQHAALTLYCISCLALNGKSCFYHVCRCVLSCLCTKLTVFIKITLFSCDSFLPCFGFGNINPWIGFHVLTLHSVRLVWTVEPHPSSKNAKRQSSQISPGSSVPVLWMVLIMMSALSHVVVWGSPGERITPVFKLCHST